MLSLPPAPPGCQSPPKAAGPPPKRPLPEPKPHEAQQKLPVDASAPFCHYPVMLGEIQTQFSLARAAQNTCGRAESKFLSVKFLSVTQWYPWWGHLSSYRVRKKGKMKTKVQRTVRVICLMGLAFSIPIGGLHAQTNNVTIPLKTTMKPEPWETPDFKLDINKVQLVDYGTAPDGTQFRHFVYFGQDSPQVIPLAVNCVTGFECDLYSGAYGGTWSWVDPVGCYPSPYPNRVGVCQLASGTNCGTISGGTIYYFDGGVGGYGYPLCKGTLSCFWGLNATNSSVTVDMPNGYSYARIRWFPSCDAGVGGVSECYPNPCTLFLPPP